MCFGIRQGEFDIYPDILYSKLKKKVKLVISPNATEWNYSKCISLLSMKGIGNAATEGPFSAPEITEQLYKHIMESGDHCKECVYFCNSENTEGRGW
jgi:hypothetical protein